MNFLEQYKKVVAEKREINKQIFQDDISPDLFLDGIVDEVKEVREEIKDDNHVYLEDELGDIFRDFCSLVYHLECDKKIGSWERVFERSLKKYKERVEAQLQGKSWKEIKAVQKKSLLKEHEECYEIQKNPQ